MLDIKKTVNGNELVIVMTGRLDTLTAPQLEEELSASIDSAENLVFDFSELEYISSAGLRVLLSAQKTKNASGSMTVKMESAFPWDGHVKITVSAERSVRDTIAVRIPGWCKEPELPELPESFTERLANGYVYMTGDWSGQTLEFNFPMETVLLQADARVREDAGKVCVARGPVIYCAEEKDNGADLHLLSVDPDTMFKETQDRILDQEIVRISAKGLRRIPEKWDALYRR